MTTTVNPEALVAVATSLNLQVTRQSRFYRIERPGDVRRIYVPTGKVVREVHLSHFESCPPAAVPFRETDKRKMPTKQVRFELDVCDVASFTAVARLIAGLPDSSASPAQELDAVLSDLASLEPVQPETVA